VLHRGAGLPAARETIDAGDLVIAPDIAECGLGKRARLQEAVAGLPWHRT
jgi:hypothetical protein